MTEQTASSNPDRVEYVSYPRVIVGSLRSSLDTQGLDTKIVLKIKNTALEFYCATRPEPSRPADPTLFQMNLAQSAMIQSDQTAQFYRPDPTFCSC